MFNESDESISTFEGHWDNSEGGINEISVLFEFWEEVLGNWVFDDQVLDSWVLSVGLTGQVGVIVGSE